MFAIYGLFDPRSPHEIRYVGLTRRSPSRRLAQICAEARLPALRRRRPVAEWALGLLKSGQRPAVVVLAMHATAEGAAATERQEIAVRQSSLLNVTNGGDIPTAEASAARRDAQLGIKKPFSTRMRMSRSHREAWAAGGWRRRHNSYSRSTLQE